MNYSSSDYIGLQYQTLKRGGLVKVSDVRS